MLALPLLFSLSLCLATARRSAELPEDVSPLNTEVSRHYGNSWIAGPNDKQYQFHIGVQSWITAREYCLTQESDLLTISSPAELNWVLSHYSPEVKSHKERLIQIGALLDDSHGMREWKWVNGEELNSTLTPWKSGEPFDHLNGRERCAIISLPSKKLDDIDCDAAGSPMNMFRFVCERTNVIHELHEINNNPLWRKVEDVLEYFGFGQAVNNMMKTLSSDEEDYWEEAKKEDADEKKKSDKKKNTEKAQKKVKEVKEPKEKGESAPKENEEGEKTEKEGENKPVGKEEGEAKEKEQGALKETGESGPNEETSSKPPTDEELEKLPAEEKPAKEMDGKSAEQPKTENETPTQTPKTVEVTETPDVTVATEGATASVNESLSTTTEGEVLPVNGTESAQHDEDPEQHKSPADDEITSNLLTVSSKKLAAEELVAVDDPQSGTVMEVFETATPETDTVRTTKAESGAGKAKVTIEDKIQNIETVIHTVEKMIGNDKINMSDILDKAGILQTATPSDEIIGKKKGEHFAGHCEEDEKPNAQTTDEKIEEFLTTLRTFLARNKLRDLSKIANAKNVNNTLIERLKEAVKKGNDGKQQQKKTEGKGKAEGVKAGKDVKAKKEGSHSDEVEKELTTVLTDSISETISNSSAEVTNAKAPKTSASEKDAKKSDDQWEVQNNEPFQKEVDAKKTAQSGTLERAFAELAKIDPKTPPVESEESKQRQRLDTAKLLERIKQNELARKRISVDRMHSLTAPAPSDKHNANAFVEMEKLFSDIGSNFRRFLTTRI
uniref:C-type lectin domain-containing protein n=1 Tax=Steinernema glaseri TaxID=37863 RepID=A0A1I7ZAV7_9BILA